MGGNENYHKRCSSRKDNKEHTCRRFAINPEDEYCEPKEKRFKLENNTKSTSDGQKTEQENVWKWWEEENHNVGIKWSTLEHKGPLFTEPYKCLPPNVRFFYDGKPFQLTKETEEAATFYAKMLNHECCRNRIFYRNFFRDFRLTMTARERKIIKDFHKCNFYEIFKFFQAESNKRLAATKEEKLAKRKKNEAFVNKYGFCLVDGHRERISNFRLEPPGLFRGRGDHPKMGMIKRRVQACDIIINCGRDSKIPMPPRGQMWKEVRHDNTVTWLASWVDNVQGQSKYIILNSWSKIRCESDHNKYETARRLHKFIDKIRATYREEWKSKDIFVRQRAVALYFIDKLALRVGNEKEKDQADTVGCCSLRVEHVQLHRRLMDKEYVVAFDFLGKDSIRYYKTVEVEPRVFNNLKLFVKDKGKSYYVFDCLNAHELNDHLKNLMIGLTTKVFRTYNASLTLQNQLDELTDEEATVAEKLLVYNRANRAVAILCNHQRSIPKGHQQIMENLRKKIHNKSNAINDLEAEFNELKRSATLSGTAKDKKIAECKGKQLERLKDQLKKLKLEETNREENKCVALTTSKLNYIDPRISVAWCKKNNVPIEKIFNKTQRTKFLWAIHMADENYHFPEESPVIDDDN